MSRLSSLIVRLDLIRLHIYIYIYIYSIPRRLRSRFKGGARIEPRSTLPYSHCRFLFLDVFDMNGIIYTISPRFFEDVIERNRERERGREASFGKGTSRKGNSVRCLPSAVCRLALQGTKPTAGSLFTVASRKQRSLLLFFERSNSRGSRVN